MTATSARQVLRRTTLVNAVLLVALAVVVIGVVRGTTGPTDGGDEPGALGASALVGPASTAALRPQPQDATADVPDTYTDGCHGEREQVVPTACERGAPDGDLVVAVVGDSKIAQWIPALDVIAEREGWLLSVFTKTNCAFSAAVVVNDDGPYEECERWGAAVLEEVTSAGTFDAVITSAVSSRASLAGEPESRDGLVEGYVNYWNQLEEAGVSVVAISDTPGTGGEPAYECVMANPDDTSRCNWTYRDGSGSSALREAAAQADVAYVQMNDRVCPQRACVAVWRDILTYRQGSHITATYAIALADALAIRLVPVVDGPGSA